MKGFLLMVTFLTRIPIKINFEFREEDFLKGIKYMPIIGMIIGALMYLIALGNKIFHPEVVSVLVWVSYIYITGGLHIDGLADSVDGVLSNRDKKRVMEIMKDSRIGAFGVISIIVLLLMNITLTTHVAINTIFIVPVVGRCCGVVAASLGECARKDGMGKAIIEYSSAKEMIFAISVTALLSYIMSGLNSVVVFAVVLIVTTLVVKFFKNKIDGMTGDTIGFTIEFTQCAYLFCAYAWAMIGEII